MKKLIVGLTLAASLAVNAQTSATTLPAAQAPAPAATATQTLTTQADSIASRIGVNVFVEAFANVKDLKEQNGNAMVDSANGIGLTYKISDILKTELRHNYQMRAISDRDQLKTETKTQIVVKDKDGNAKLDDDKKEIMETRVAYENPYKALDPTIHLNVNTGISLLGAKPLTIGNRYYIPVSDDSLKAKSAGVLRTQTAMTWDLNPKVAVEVAAQIRLYMFTGRNEADKGRTRGADSELRYIVGPSATYSFNDNLNVYWNPYLDLKTTGHNRGELTRADLNNQLNQDIGVNIMFGNYTINPYWTSVATRNADREAYEGMGLDENSNYGLFLNAVF